MPKEYNPTSSARAISSSRCAIRSSGPTRRSVEGSVTAATKLSTPTCTAVLLGGSGRPATVQCSTSQPGRCDGPHPPARVAPRCTYDARGDGCALPPQLSMLARSGTTPPPTSAPTRTPHARDRGVREPDPWRDRTPPRPRSEDYTSELQSRLNFVCR